MSVHQITHVRMVEPASISQAVTSALVPQVGQAQIVAKVSK